MDNGDEVSKKHAYEFFLALKSRVISEQSKVAFGAEGGT
jgi:hypothetical protein